MHIAPESIIIKKRVRQDPGDLEPLMESLRKYGQLNPIMINHRYELIAGYRRVEAAKLLGWRSINAVIIDRDSEEDKLEIELEENIQRRNLTAEEISEGFTRLQKLKQRGFFILLLKKILDFFIKIFKTIFKRGKL